MTLDAWLLEILACPTDKQGLLYFADEDLLYNPRLKKAYRVHEGIPVMLPDEAIDIADDAHARLTAKAEAEGIAPPVIEPQFWPAAQGDWQIRAHAVFRIAQD